MLQNLFQIKIYPDISEKKIPLLFEWINNIFIYFTLSIIIFSDIDINIFFYIRPFSYYVVN